MAFQTQKLTRFKEFPALKYDLIFTSFSHFKILQNRNAADLLFVRSPFLKTSREKVVLLIDLMGVQACVSDLPA